MTRPVDPRDLRVSDEERSHVLALLERATGRGLIDLGEYADRSSKAIAARTRGDLNALLMDLPGLQIAGHSVAGAQQAVADPIRPTPGFSGAVRGDPMPQVLELTGWGSRVYRGFWTAPPLIVIGGTGATTRLDFTAAQLVSPTVTVEFRSNFGGAAEFVVPRGATVRAEGLQLRGGHLSNKVTHAPSGGGMTLVITGMKKAGSVTIRNPKRGRWF